MYVVGIGETLEEILVQLLISYAYNMFSLCICFVCRELCANLALSDSFRSNIDIENEYNSLDLSEIISSI